MKSPRFVVKKSSVIEQYEKIRNICDYVSYSLKTNPIIGKILEEETDCMFSIHSFDSFDRVKDKNRIVFLPQAWNIDQVKEVFDIGIKKFVIDNKNDLDILMKFLEGSEIKPDILIRIKMKERNVFTERHFVFGINLDEINVLIKDLRDSGKFNKIGIHFHKKTQNIGEWDIKKELENILDENILEMIDFINIGGGIPIKYKNYENETPDYIFESILKLKTWLNSKNIELISEPGRFIAGPPVKLETEIINVYENTVIVNCSVYNSFMDTFIANAKLIIENEKESGEFYLIKGITPDSLDVFRYKVFLENPKIGDKIVFLNAGAYNFSSDFCDLKKIETIIV